MAMIEKLQVQGIRSFGHHDSDRQNVEFFSPLTLILGQNGCGKTTIIECLKYITTGDCPPGSRSGASFVHDPNMAKENMVRGQVKLLFKTIDNKDKIVVRSLEATKKVKSITIKTMDSSVSTRMPDGTVKTVSSKCADLNSEMFFSLGVSKPILNYVIFCHQEDSNWPLEEGKKVKDKFDEIFDSQKYKNCLNNIREIRKLEKDNLKMESINMGHFRSDRELCKEKEKDLKKRKINLDQNEQDIVELKEKLKPLEEQNRRLYEEEKGFAHIQSKITEAQTKLDCSKTARKQLKVKIDEVYGEDISDEQLQQRLLSLHDEAHQNREEIKELERELESIKKKEKVVQFKMQKNAASLGKLHEVKDRHDKEKLERTALGENIEDMLRITATPETLVQVLKDEEEKMNKQIEKFKADRADAENRLSDEIDELKKEKATLGEKKKRGQADLMEVKGQIAKLRRELSELEGADEQINKIKNKLEEKTAELKYEREKMNGDEVQKEIKAARQQIGDLEKKEDALREELAALEEQQAIAQQIDYLKQDIQEKEEKKQRILSKRNKDLVDIFSSIPDVKRLKATFKSMREKTERESKEISDRKQKEITKLSSKTEINIQMKKDQAQKKKKERELKTKVYSVLDTGDDLESELAKSKDKLEVLRKDLQVKEAGTFVYSDLLDKMEIMNDSPCCPTCNRDFKTKSEAENLKQELESMIQEIPRKVEGLKKRVSDEDKRYNQLQKIAPDYHKYMEIQQVIKDVDTQIENAEKDIKQLKESKELLDEEYQVIFEKMEKLNSMSDDIQVIDNLAREIATLTEKQKDLMSTCAISDEDRGLDMIRNELKDISATIKSTRKQCETQQDEFNAHSKLINDLESSCNKLTNKKLEIEGKQQQRANTLDKKTELEARLVKIQSGIDDSSQELDPLQEKLDGLESEKIEQRRRNDAGLEKLQTKGRKIENYKAELKRLDDSIEAYVSSGKKNRLEEVLQEMKELEEENETMRKKKNENEKSHRSIQEQLANQDGIKRNLEDNIELRKLVCEETKHKTEINQLNDKLKTTDFARVTEKRILLCRAMEEINADVHSKLGTIAEMKKSIAEIEKELENPKLKNASRLYRESWIKHGTIKMAVDDLNQYYIALDLAITKFHREKMGHVNSIIREIWKNTYRGNDIDYIEIRTDDGEIGAGADKKKTYNYRVVMVKSNVEMDMRGRQECSAGQKVLASLIIRLALAETFAENCGIIALDEPTTNLDRENIESLAMALSAIATRQAQNSHFQLVIITHDEEFIEQLSRNDKIQYYQKVSRNSRGISEIRKMNVSTLEGVAEE